MITQVSVNPLPQQAIVGAMVFRIQNGPRSVKELANRHGNFSGELPEWAMIVEPNPTVSDRRLRCACDRLRIEYLLRFTGIKANKWQRKRGYFRPGFRGVVIRILDYSRLARELLLEEWQEYNDRQWQEIYNDDDH